MSSSDTDHLGICNIYAQDSWHMESFIIGNKEGLLELKNAIDEALNNKIGEAELFPSDFEGYTTYVALVEDEEKFAKLCMPYTNEQGVGKEEYSIHPIDVIKELKK
ncbi:hypothetical protein [Virgibacillus chiguensis]|uniref:Uncharacterized protein n=1 Tax=Virgibacillus chiguensis TaxID=411959 RepID=A0A1M5R562_9BACI|nr:hypothetical protein [Virgibacillus chiguensis]SHH21482.1 hypothetical protein SAMN05421807_10524 [Virgibacillus chiguensis]